MRICSCEHPSYIRNKWTGELIASPCGKCDSCKNQRAKKWVDKLCQENKLHKFVYMVNPTYSDEYLPMLGLSDCGEYLEFMNRDCNYRIPLRELHDIMWNQHETYDKDYMYFNERLKHRLGIPCVYPKDFSDFFKRLNKKIHDKVTGKYENFRYFCAHEYGGTTLRPHAHMLIWFDDERISKVFEALLSSCWKFGICTSSPVYSRGGINYVAQYVNLSTHLPSFYSHPKMRQKLQFSKFPSIGFVDVLDEEIRGIYDSLPTRRSVWDVFSSKYTDVSVPPAFKDRFFPKLQGYRDLSYSDRVTLYGVCEKIPAFDFEQFRCSLRDIEWLHFRYLANPVEELIYQYYHRMIKNAPALKQDCVKSAESIKNGLYRWFSVSKRVCVYASLLNTSVSWIVSRIDDFWIKLDYENLTDFYEFQHDYCITHAASDLLCAYPEFYNSACDLFIHGKITIRDSLLVSALNTFNICDEDDFHELQETFDYNAMKSKSLHIYKDTRKSKQIREYLYSRTFDRSDSDLQKILINYTCYDEKKHYECS